MPGDLRNLSRGSGSCWRSGCDPGPEPAFLDGYGADPREASAWHRTLVREATGTAGWAYRARDERFGAQGHRMIADVLASATG